MGVVHYLADKLVNALNGTGTSRDPRTGNRYVSRPLSQQEIAAAYSGSGLMRKIVQIPALDMVREWRDWKLEAEEITAVEAEETRLAIRQKVRQAEVLRGMGGGALILGLPGNPYEPAPESIDRGKLAYVHVVSRWQLTFEQLQDDARLPRYGEPAMWRITTGSGQQPIHPSRVIPFRADTTASLAMPTSWNATEAFWGESTVQQVLEAVQDNDQARAAFAALVHKARLLRLGIPKLMETVATEGGEELVQKRLAAVVMAESIHNATIFDAGDPETGKGGETITDAQYKFEGARDILNAYGEFVAAIADIPATRLLGRAPEGMNASGESQQKDWGKLVVARQTLELAPNLDRLDRYLVPSALGRPPKATTWYAFAPLDLPTEKEIAERFKLEAEAMDKIGGLAAIPDRAFNRGVQSLLIDRGYLPELEQALAEIPEEERWGIQAELDPEGGDPASAGADGPPEPVRRAANDAAPRTLYVQRKLLNADELIRWAKAQGFETTLPAEDMHVTIAFSRQPVDWLKVGSSWNEDKDGGFTVPPGGARIVEALGDKDAVVLLFNSSELSWRHESIKRDAGASWDWDDYQPHVTLTYAKPGDLDLRNVEPYRGELRFGPEIFEEIDDEWADRLTEDGGSRTSGPPFGDAKRARKGGRGSFNPALHPRGKGGKFISKGGSAAAKLIGGAPKNAAFIQAQTGVDVSKLKRVARPTEIAHAMKGSSRGKMRFPPSERVLQNYASHAAKAYSVKRQGSPSGSGLRLRSEIRIAGRSHTLIERVGRKKGELAFLTMWRNE